MKIYRCRRAYRDLPDQLELADQDDFVMFPGEAPRSFYVYRPIGSHATPGVVYELEEREGWYRAINYPGLEYAVFVKIGD